MKYEEYIQTVEMLKNILLPLGVIEVGGIETVDEQQAIADPTLFIRFKNSSFANAVRNAMIDFYVPLHNHDSRALAPHLDIVKEKGLASTEAVSDFTHRLKEEIARQSIARCSYFVDKIERDGAKKNYFQGEAGQSIREIVIAEINAIKTKIEKFPVDAIEQMIEMVAHVDHVYSLRENGLAVEQQLKYQEAQVHVVVPGTIFATSSAVARAAPGFNKNLQNT